jgi:hypothetical protein
VDRHDRRDPEAAGGHQDRCGIARYVVRVPVMAAVERIVAAVGD